MVQSPAVPDESQCDHLTPLEIMAKAYISAGISPKYWDELSAQNRMAIAANMRAALLALAEAELPDSLRELGYHACCNDGDPEPEPVVRAFRSMLREIAGESK